MNVILNGIELPKVRPEQDYGKLLSEWKEANSNSSRRALRLGLALAALVMATFVALPQLDQVRLHYSTSLASDLGNLAVAKQTLERINRSQNEGLAASSSQEFEAGAVRNFDTFLGESYEVLNATGPNIALASVSVEARNGQIMIRCTGESVNFASLSEFARQTSSKSALGAITNTRPSTVLSTNGVFFEYTKQVPIE